MEIGAILRSPGTETWAWVSPHNSAGMSAENVRSAGHSGTGVGSLYFGKLTRNIQKPSHPHEGYELGLVYHDAKWSPNDNWGWLITGLHGRDKDVGLSMTLGIFNVALQCCPKPQVGSKC